MADNAECPVEFQPVRLQAHQRRSKFRPESLFLRPSRQAKEGPIKLVIGKPDDSEVVIAEETGGTWKPNQNLLAQLEAFLKGANPEDFEMWVEEDE